MVICACSPLSAVSSVPASSASCLSASLRVSVDCRRAQHEIARRERSRPRDRVRAPRAPAMSSCNGGFAFDGVDEKSDAHVSRSYCRSISSGAIRSRALASRDGASDHPETWVDRRTAEQTTGMKFLHDGKMGGGDLAHPERASSAPTAAR